MSTAWNVTKVRLRDSIPIIAATLSGPPTDPFTRKSVHEGKSKPDSDNIAKLIGDALNGIAWVDDTSIVRLSIQKVFRESAGLSVAVSVIGAGA